jgi:hypothetical protein
MKIMIIRRFRRFRRWANLLTPTLSSKRRGGNGFSLVQRGKGVICLPPPQGREGEGSSLSLERERARVRVKCQAVD